MGNRVELDEMGKKILDASRTELYLSMRFLGPALHSLGFVMDLSTTSVGTDAAYIRFNPNYLFRLYVDRPRLLNRTYLHMVLHCVFRHMFTAREKEDLELWDLACDIAVDSIIDSMDYYAVSELTTEFRQRWYSRLEEEIKVLTAERIYQYFLERKRNYMEELQLAAAFAMDDHSFWERMEDGKEENEESGDRKDSAARDENGEDPERPDENRDAPDRPDENRDDPDSRGKNDRDPAGQNDDREDPDRQRKDRDDPGRQKDMGHDTGRKGNRDPERKDPGQSGNRDPEEKAPGHSRNSDPERSDSGNRTTPPAGGRRRQDRVPHLKKKNPEELEGEWKETSKRMEAELLATGKEASRDRGSLDRILAISNRRRTDYREFLRRFAILREVTTIDPDSFDYGFYNYGLEIYGNMPLIEENEYREMNQIRTLVIAIDTSASCQDTLVQRFLNETAAVLRSIGQFFASSAVWIVECDEHVQHTVLIREPEDLERYAEKFHVKGGFGTDFRPVFAWVEDMRRTGQIRDMEGLMYFTDGMGVYPDRSTDYDTAFVFFNDEELDDTRVPDWAVRLYIEGDKVRGR